MLFSLRRVRASVVPSPARPSGAPFRSLALTARMAFAGMLTSGLGLPAFAQSAAKAAADTAEHAIQLPETVATGRTDGDPVRPYAGGQTARGARAGLLGNKDTMDTPFSVSTYTARRMEDQQATTLADVLNKDASVRFTGQTGGVTDSFYIRGFPVGEGNLSEVAFDGVYGVAPNYHVFPEYMELERGKSTTFRATVLNVFDPKYKYWSGVASVGTISLGAPRTVLLSASVDF